MQHIIGMPLQLIIIGMPHSIILFISMQQFLNISMFMPCIGIILHIIMSPCMEHSIMHFMAGMPMFMPIIIGIMLAFIMPIIGIMAMAGWDMPIIIRLPQCIIIGMPQFIIIAIISALLRNMAISMPMAGFILHIMPSSSISHSMVAIIIGMPIIGIMALVFIGICMAFIMVELPESIGMKCCEWGRF
ncbi:hypothetical protein A9513_005095 [Pseudomonas sp. AU12215]|nr:hypothetical protein A9513_005095 [Pseudomonas sp. AU12215]